MSFFICGNTTIQCCYGSASSALLVQPFNRCMTRTPLANIMDYKPMLNIQPFGMCSFTGNPAVAQATAANSGVLTPIPCIPVTQNCWKPGSSTVSLNHFAALTMESKLQCQWGGVIQILISGQNNIVIS